MKFCSDCSAPVEYKIPEGDTLPRYVCPTCKSIHYQNPKIVVNSIPEWEEKILLCRRSIEPRYGLWTLPGGFMENDETISQAAVREALEEAHAQIELLSIYMLLSVPRINQVHIFYRAHLRNLNFSAGAETLEVALFEESTIPWNKLAFRTITTTLKSYFEDRQKGIFTFHSSEILN